METNESLSLETFPKRYEVCFLENCAVREDCLHHLYFKLQPVSNTWGDAIFPSVLMPENLVNGRCRMFHAKRLVTCYAGFTHFFDEVRRKDLPSLSNEIYSYFRGCVVISIVTIMQRMATSFIHQKAEDIKGIFRKYGYDAPRYDRTFEFFLFTNKDRFSSIIKVF